MDILRNSNALCIQDIIGDLLMVLLKIKLKVFIFRIVPNTLQKFLIVNLVTLLHGKFVASFGGWSKDDAPL
jgi:hypothetical protein